jgi:hypothetical protein
VELTYDVVFGDFSTNGLKEDFLIVMNYGSLPGPSAALTCAAHCTGVLELNLCDVVEEAQYFGNLTAYKREIGSVWLAVVSVELLESENGELPVILQKLCNDLSSSGRRATEETSFFTFA